MKKNYTLPVNICCIKFYHNNKLILLCIKIVQQCNLKTLVSSNLHNSLSKFSKAMFEISKWLKSVLWITKNGQLKNIFSGKIKTCYIQLLCFIGQVFINLPLRRYTYTIHTLMKSCIETVAREWRLAEIELSEAEKTPATKRPDSPGTPPSICSTNSGTNWSWLLMTPDLSQQ